MPRPPLLPGLEHPTGRALPTRRALVEAAREMFAAHGYTVTSLDTIVARAEVTKGALYHHFSSKVALFEAVLESVEQDAARTVADALSGHDDPWSRARAGLGAFVRTAQESAYRRIVVCDAPAVVGHERLRELEEGSTFAVVLGIVESMVEPTRADPTRVELAARMAFGALSAAGESIASSADPVAAVRCVDAAVDLVLAGCRAMAEAGTASSEPDRGRLLDARW